MELKKILGLIDETNVRKHVSSSKISIKLSERSLNRDSLKKFQQDLEKQPQYYLEVGDNVHANVCSWLDVNCGDSENRWFIPGACSDHGHRYAKTIYCGKEWCPVCGKKGSPSHNRRFVRWYKKITTIDQMRYFVFTIPPALRDKYRTQESLREFGRLVQTLLIKYGYKRGLRRWHWFGDPPRDKQKKKMVYNPHLNVIVDGGYIHKDVLEKMHKDYDQLIGYDKADFEVSYKNTVPKKLQCLSYVTRATFLDYNWDIDMALELRNFRNMVVWGRDWDRLQLWGSEKKERVNINGESIDVVSIENLMEHKCPLCHSKMIWGKALPERLLALTDSIDLGAGFRYITDRPPPEHINSLVYDHLSTMELIKAAKMLGAVELKDYKPKKK